MSSTGRLPRIALVDLMLPLELIGCGGHGAPPSAPSTVLQVSSPPNPPVVGIQGFVADSGYRAVPGARVEIVAGMQMGESTATDANGRFSFSGTFDNTTTLRVTKDDHVAATQVLSASQRSGCTSVCTGTFLFYLDVLAQPVDIAGDYTVTFVADSACTDLPSELRSRTYAATIAPAPNPGSVSGPLSSRAVMSGSPFLGNLNGFRIGVAGHYLGISLDGRHDPTIVEQLAPNTYLAFSGSANTTVETGASTISTPFDGWIEYCVVPSPMAAYYNCGTSNITGEPIPGAALARATCDSKNHRLIMTRR